VDPVTLATSRAGVFAGGDVAFGPRNLIEAVANGKRAAQSIRQFLSPRDMRIEVHLEIEELPTSTYRMFAGFEQLDREGAPTLDLGRRTGIAEVETGYGPDAARAQAARCLVCHVQTIYDPEKCVLCNRCVDVCPEYCLAFVPFDERDAALAFVTRLRDTSLETWRSGDCEWRVHFHVPVFLEQLEDSSSTQPFVREMLALHRQQSRTPHLEVETYTWSVLPARAREVPIEEAIARELLWVQGELA